MRASGSVWITLAMLLLMVPFAASSRPEIYQWTDRSGRVHFVDHIDKVPQPFRSKAKKVGNRGTYSNAPSKSSSSQTNDESVQQPHERLPSGPYVPPEVQAVDPLGQQDPQAIADGGPTPDGALPTVTPGLAPTIPPELAEWAQPPQQESPPASAEVDEPAEPQVPVESKAPVESQVPLQSEGVIETEEDPEYEREPSIFSDLYDFYVRNALLWLVPVLVFPLLIGFYSRLLDNNGSASGSRSVARFGIGVGVAAVFIEFVSFVCASVVLGTEVLSRVDLLAASYPFYLLVATVYIVSRLHSLRDLLSRNASSAR